MKRSYASPETWKVAAPSTPDTGEVLGRVHVHEQGSIHVCNGDVKLLERIPERQPARHQAALEHGERRATVAAGERAGRRHARVRAGTARRQAAQEVGVDERAVD